MRYELIRIIDKKEGTIYEPNNIFTDNDYKELVNDIEGTFIDIKNLPYEGKNIVVEYK